MKAYHLQFSQVLPLSLQETWNFFSSPMNLAEITPADMAFTVTSDPELIRKMYAGMIITYKISPIAGIKLNWMTEITQVAEGKYFIDEQRFGPYKFWHHQHHFQEVAAGTLMTDILTYGLPLGPIGDIANSLFVGKKLQDIFEFRRKKIIALFGESGISATI
jgi:ligand-binding SRPBCC domain-containing protein